MHGEPASGRGGVEDVYNERGPGEVRRRRDRRERIELQRRAERARTIVAAQRELRERAHRGELLELALVRARDTLGHRTCEQQADAEDEREATHALAYPTRAG